MKRKLTLITVIALILTALFALNINAEEVQNAGGIYVSDSNEYGTVNIIDSYDYSAKLSLEQRVVLDNGDGTYSTYPTAYLLDYNRDASKRGERFQYFDPSILNDETGFTYTLASVIRLEIPEGITIIHHDDRSNINLVDCDSMVECVFPSTLATFTKSELLNGCTSLASVDFSRVTKVTTMPQSTMANCTSLTDIKWPQKLAVLNTSSLQGCTALVTTTLPDTVVTLGKNAFYGCTSLTGVTMPDTVKNFGEACFRGCTSIVTFDVPSSVTTISTSCFNGCTALTTVTMSDNVTSLSTYAFNNCSALSSITLSNSITSIGGQAFYQCNSLTQITLPDSITTLGNKCFQNAKGLTSIVLPASLKTVPQDGFNGCSALTSVTMSDNVTSIAGYAFNGCSQLSSIRLSSNITSIGSYAFGSCPFTSINMPTALETVGSQAFRGSGITALHFPSTLKKIDNQAFYQCAALTEVTLGSSLESIGNEAFGFCKLITEIELPKTLKTFGTYVFNNCSGIQSITIPSDSLLAGTWRGIFSGCTALTSIYVPSGVTKFEYDVFNGCSSLTSITFGEGLLEIADKNNFKNCSSLKSLKLPNSLVTLYETSFPGCSALEELWLGDSLQSLGAGNLTLKALKRVYIPSTVTTVGAHLLGYTNTNDSSKNITFVFTGDYNEAIALRELVRADSANAACASKLYDATLVYAKDFDISAEPSGYTFVYGYSKCEAFYQSHSEIPHNVCVNYCQVCQGFIPLSSPSHNFEGGESIVYTSYMQSGTKTRACQNEGCEANDGSAVTVSPIFEFVGYSIHEIERSFLAVYTVNLDALEEFEAATGIKLEYGIVCAAIENLGGKEPLDPYTGKAITLEKGVVKRHNASKYSSSTVTARLENISAETLDTRVFLCGYVFDGKRVQYIAQTITNNLPEQTSYAIVRGPIETEISGMKYTTEDIVTEQAGDRIKQQNASNADYNTGSSLSSSQLTGFLGVKSKAQLIAAGGSLINMPAASALMNHYLKNTGATYNLDVASFLTDDSGALSNRNKAINNALRAAEILAREGEVLTVNQQAEGHPMQGSLATQNWQYALGSYFDDVDIINLTVETIDGVKVYTADIKYIVIDFYNWDTNDYNKFKNIVSPHDLHELHKAGIAREFLTYGEITYSSITWQEGADVSSLGF